MANGAQPTGGMTTISGRSVLVTPSGQEVGSAARPGGNRISGGIDRPQTGMSDEERRRQQQEDTIRKEELRQQKISQGISRLEEKLRSGRLSERQIFAIETKIKTLRESVASQSLPGKQTVERPTQRANTFDMMVEQAKRERKEQFDRSFIGRLIKKSTPPRDVQVEKSFGQLYKEGDLPSIVRKGFFKAGEVIQKKVSTPVTEKLTGEKITPGQEEKLSKLTGEVFLTSSLFNIGRAGEVKFLTKEKKISETMTRKEALGEFSRLSQGEQARIIEQAFKFKKPGELRLYVKREQVLEDIKKAEKFMTEAGLTKLQQKELLARVFGTGESFGGVITKEAPKQIIMETKGGSQLLKRTELLQVEAQEMQSLGMVTTVTTQTKQAQIFDTKTLLAQQNAFATQTKQTQLQQSAFMQDTLQKQEKLQTQLQDRISKARVTPLTIPKTKTETTTNKKIPPITTPQTTFEDGGGIRQPIRIPGRGKQPGKPGKPKPPRPPRIIIPLPLGNTPQRAFSRSTGTTRRTQGYIPQVKARGKWVSLLKKALSLREARALAADVVDNTISAQLRLMKSKKKISKLKNPPRLKEQKFRDFKITKGVTKTLKNFGLIERRGNRIDTPGEKKELSVARYMKSSSFGRKAKIRKRRGGML